MRLVRTIWGKIMGTGSVNRWFDKQCVRQMEILLCREAISNLSFALCINEVNIPHTLMLNNINDSDYLNDRFGDHWFEFLTSIHKNELLAQYLRDKEIISDNHILRCFQSMESFTEFIDNMDELQALRRASRPAVYGSLALT